MIVWVNGTFGAGKTTTSTLVAQRDSRFRLFDPEWVGYLLTNNLADHDVADFQQLDPWRRLVPLVADELIRFTGQHLVAAQTVLEVAYWDQLEAGLAALGHEVLLVVLEADEPVLRERIAADENDPGAAAWRLDHLSAYAAARPWLHARADAVVDTTLLTVDQATDRVWQAIATSLS